MPSANTYLLSKEIIDKLLANSQFVSLAQDLVTKVKGSFDWAVIFNNLNILLTSLGITQSVEIFKSDGSYYYNNYQSPDQVLLGKNQNTSPEVTESINYAYGNPICNNVIYPDYLQPSVNAGYGFAERLSNLTIILCVQYVSFTYKFNDNPLANNIFTIRVFQSL